MKLSITAQLRMLAKGLNTSGNKETAERLMTIAEELDKQSSPASIVDYLKANEDMLTKTKAKVVTISSLKEFAGIK
ncbi:hypothetical protein VOWphi5012_063 [Vibrio phage phi50-12]|uniref:Uncharacterized protein n=1 Tax=Vibrio phage phi50-12 TaxID=2654972 RepID=A0A5P8PRC8_9CAUD|nr:hypothetical protein KNU82_gp063 [Vibrio phage phi50-12]QFR59847.1 hypothetical protein VOWphi5012_063 [Vibrio phage phi50-12]